MQCEADLAKAYAARDVAEAQRRADQARQEARRNFWASFFQGIAGAGSSVPRQNNLCSTGSTAPGSLTAFPC